MIAIETFRAFARTLPEVEEVPHFAIPSFRVKKKIFATLNEAENRATLRFSLEMQDIFSTISKGAIFPVPNKWGKYGWTHINLETAEWELCQDALQNAWWEVAPQTIRNKYPSLNIE
jgi:hypothetical protein